MSRAFHEFIFDPKQVQHHGDIETCNTSTRDTNRKCPDHCRDIAIGSRTVGRNVRSGTIGISVLIDELLDRFFISLGEGLRAGIRWLWSAEAHTLDEVDSDNPIL
jgi:hypothetical protein